MGEGLGVRVLGEVSKLIFSARLPTVSIQAACGFNEKKSRASGNWLKHFDAKFFNHEPHEIKLPQENAENAKADTDCTNLHQYKCAEGATEISPGL